MAAKHVMLAVVDEAAALDGSRPLETIADWSGVGWGAVTVQMAEDLSRFHVLCTASGGAEPGPAGLPPLRRRDVGAAEGDKGPEEGAEHYPSDQLDGSRSDPDLVGGPGPEPDGF